MIPIPKRHRAELPADHPMVITEDKAGRPIVILADWVAENRETERRLVGEAMRWWKSTKRNGLAVVPIGLAAGAAWAADQMKNPIISATTGVAVTAAAFAVFLPAAAHHPTHGVSRPPVAAPPATPAKPAPSRTSPPNTVAPVSHTRTTHRRRYHPTPTTHTVRRHRSGSTALPVVPVVRKVLPSVPSTPIAKNPAPVTGEKPAQCPGKGLLGSQTTIGGLGLCL